MSIQFFDEQSTGSSDLLFAKDYLGNNPSHNGQSYPINEVSLVRSNKGYLCKTDNFVCWIWKRETTATLLLQALEVYVRDGYGYTIVAVLDDKSSNGFRLGVDGDKPCMWYGSTKKYTVTPDIPIFDPQKGNPFLISHAPLTPTTEPASQPGTNGASRKKHGQST